MGYNTIRYDPEDDGVLPLTPNWSVSETERTSGLEEQETAYRMAINSACQIRVQSPVPSAGVKASSTSTP